MSSWRGVQFKKSTGITLLLPSWFSLCVKSHDSYLYELKNYSNGDTCISVKLCYHTLREEHRLKVFEDRVPREIFGPKRKEVRRS